jgi:hypothetical protein
VDLGELGEGRSAAFLAVQGLQQIEPAGQAANHGVFGTAILAHRRKPCQNNIVQQVDVLF